MSAKDDRIREHQQRGWLGNSQPRVRIVGLSVVFFTSIFLGVVIVVGQLYTRPKASWSLAALAFGFLGSSSYVLLRLVKQSDGAVLNRARKDALTMFALGWVFLVGGDILRRLHR